MSITVFLAGWGCFTPEKETPGADASTSEVEPLEPQEATGTSLTLTSTETGESETSDTENAAVEVETSSEAPIECENEACECQITDLRRCSEGGYAGRCADGWQTCNLDGTWSSRCSIAPLAADTCDPGNDDNCNGIVNEGCPCTAGATRPCRDGGYVGPCAQGVQACLSDGTWGDCSIAPRERDGCALGNNDDCRGLPNEGCSCIEGETTRECGVCEDGVQTCVDGHTGQYGSCEGASQQNVYFQDLDGDGFGTEVSIQVCGDPPEMFARLGGDCDDADPDVFPGQTESFTEPRTDGSFDYDCDGVITYSINIGDSRGAENCVVAGDECTRGEEAFVEVLRPCGGTEGYIGCSWVGQACSGFGITIYQHCR